MSLAAFGICCIASMEQWHSLLERGTLTMISEVKFTFILSCINVELYLEAT